MEVAPSGFTVERIDCVVLRAFPDGEVLSGRNLAVKEVVRLSGLKLLKLCHSALLTVIVTLPSMPLPSLLPGSLRFSLTGSAPGLAAFRSISEQNTTLLLQRRVPSRQIRYVPAGTAAPLSSLRSQKKPACPLWAWRRLRRRCCHPSFSEDLPQQPRTSGSQGASHTLCALR